MSLCHIMTHNRAVVNKGTDSDTVIRLAYVRREDVGVVMRHARADRAVRAFRPCLRTVFGRVGEVS